LADKKPLIGRPAPPPQDFDKKGFKKKETLKKREFEK
jgi:hypothetical protein